MSLCKTCYDKHTYENVDYANEESDVIIDLEILKIGSKPGHKPEKSM